MPFTLSQRISLGLFVILQLGLCTVDAATLTGTLTEIIRRPTEINLSSKGALDWVHWGLSGASVTRKVGVSAQIGNVLSLPGTKLKTGTDIKPTFVWTDGDGPRSASTQKCFRYKGQGGGFSLPTQAAQQARSLGVVIDVRHARVRITARLSDASAPNYVTVLDSPEKTKTFAIDLSFASGSSNASLLVEARIETNYGASHGGVALGAAYLSGADATVVVTPVISPPGGQFNTPQQVSLATTTSGAAIRYTLDGSKPGGTSTLYTGPFSVSTSTTVKAFATRNGFGPSAVASAVFTISAPTKTLFSDNFNDGNAKGWTTAREATGVAYGWAVTGGEYRQTKPNEFFGYWNNGFDDIYRLGAYAIPKFGSTLRDYRAEVTLRPQSKFGHGCGLMWRYRNSSNYYRLSFSHVLGSTLLQKKVAGKWHTLAMNSKGLPADIPVKVAVEMKGPIMQVYVDGAKHFAAYDTSLSSGTIGLYARERCGFDNVRIATLSPAPKIMIASPEEHMVVSPRYVDAKAVVMNRPAGASVKFFLDGNPCKTTRQPKPGLYKGRCSAPSPGVYTLEARLFRNGQLVDSDIHTHVGLGGRSYASGADSIVWGLADKYSSDGNSRGGWRVALHGIQSNLIDILNGPTPLRVPHMVYNTAVAGDESIHLDQRVPSIMEQHPQAGTYLELVGTNDAGGTMPRPSGLNCAGAACNGTFYQYVQSVVDTLSGAGKAVFIALPPPRFGANGTSVPYTHPDSALSNRFIKKYIQVIRFQLTKHRLGPDFYAFFLGTKNRFHLMADNLHPNSLGTVVMAYLWRNAITGDTTLPFFVEDLCVRLSRGAACENPLSYKQDLIEKGDVLYADKAFTLKNAPPAALREGRWIRTRDAHKGKANPDLLSFDVGQLSTLYVAFDEGATQRPSWLKAYAKTGLVLKTSNPAARTLRLYRKNNVQGKVTLGGAASGSTGAKANYLVIVVAN